jgi:putative ABC transport system permease protein
MFISLALLLFSFSSSRFNFVNLSTARGSKRAKEVGVKKTFGVLRQTLITQFQVENMLITFFSMLLALGVMEILRLLLSPLGIVIPLSAEHNAILLAAIVLLPVIIGFLAGLYPSIYLTSFNPAQVLKGRLISGFRSSGLRNALVVFQFTISIGLMAATLIVFDQLNYFLNKDLGFEKENLLIINRASKLGNQLESFRDEVANYPGVVNASLSMDIRVGFQDIFTKEGDDRKITLAQCKIDEHFFDVTQLTLVAGRTFQEDRPSDKNAAIINEAAARLLEWTPQEALGKHINYPGDNMSKQEIIGVVRDFHFQSLRQNVEPLIFFSTRSSMWGRDRIMLVKYNTNDIQQLLQRIENRWSQLVNATPLETSFYDEELKRQYQEEQQMGQLFSIFTGLSIIIAIIGLVGLVAYAAEQRKKEIGIRKVLGASLGKIYVMINSQYVKLMLVSLLLATPIVWWAMQQWLNTFTYKVEISVWTFVVAGIAELAIALLCVGYLALRAAMLNPVNVLKEE